jgi:hypothetical protein
MIGSGACVAAAALPGIGERVIEFLAGHRDPAVLKALDERLTALGVRPSWALSDWPPSLWNVAMIWPVRFVVMEADMLEYFEGIANVMPEIMTALTGRPAARFEREGAYWAVLDNEKHSAAFGLSAWRDCLRFRGQAAEWEPGPCPVPEGDPLKFWPASWRSDLRNA